ncbi:purine-nucleoside phosphorylase [Thermosediminibacter litoriperuensis]|uniref:Purine nucleoside phosphorylase n=1 Tax=Thermosediminibacter litoriperuensis TaxID=291989 RepID=A0A5S5AXC4_9FIRM|nr:purine-nucleoside phosphorylase [Thermosediminibacter litoriperuensis]TYP56110.1 purine-nucleoside phosphorylase [Thermosediminibacter litoriperuensis]
MTYYDELKKAVEYIKSRPVPEPEIGIILGSGLGDFADGLEDRIGIPYAEIPGFPVSTVKGHRGNLVFGRASGRTVAVMQGRFHLYEGYPVQKVVFGTRVLGLLGIKALIVTNAAGGINENFRPGDLMIIKDHINLTGENPAAGEEIPELGPRFFDMTFAYDVELRNKAKQDFAKAGLEYREGVYAFLKGPSYETPAEIRMLKAIGADAVGMSTVPEVIAARQMGIRVMGISCITNMAAGILDKPLSHAEVLEVSERVKEKFVKVLGSIIGKIN